MNYDPQLIRDFAARTRINLDFIEEQQKKGGNVFEVTQLVNSLLGLLIFPQQTYYEEIPEIPINQLTEMGWPAVRVTPRIRNSSHYRPCTNLRELVRYLRNAISHFNVIFLADGLGQLSGLRVWNNIDGNKTNPKNWEAELDLKTLRELTFRFIALLEDQVIDKHNISKDGIGYQMIEPWIINTLITAGSLPDPEGLEALALLENIRDKDEINNLHWSDWDLVTQTLETEDLISLIRALTVAEHRFSWTGGSVSAVIWTFRDLEKRQHKQSDLLADWILHRTSNPYEPFGRNNKGAKSLDEYRSLLLSKGNRNG